VGAGVEDIAGFVMTGVDDVVVFVMTGMNDIAGFVMTGVDKPVEFVVGGKTARADNGAGVMVLVLGETLTEDETAMTGILGDVTGAVDKSESDKMEGDVGDTRAVVKLEDFSGIVIFVPIEAESLFVMLVSGLFTWQAVRMWNVECKKSRPPVSLMYVPFQ
jgi:hypothetical protein